MSSGLEAPGSNASFDATQPADVGRCPISAQSGHLPLLYLIFVLLIFRSSLLFVDDNQVGVDGGAYLISAYEQLGRMEAVVGFPRPPLAPGWLLAPFIVTLGDITGLKVWSLLISLTPTLSVYAITFNLTKHKFASFLAACFISFDVLQAEMLVTGALPLLGFSLIVLSMLALNQIVVSKSRYGGYLLGGSLALIPWINQTSAGLAVIVLPVYVSILLIYYEGEGSGRWVQIKEVLTRIAPGIIAGAFMGLFSLPWYVALAPGQGLTHHGGEWIFTVYSLNYYPWWLLIIGTVLFIFVFKLPREGSGAPRALAASCLTLCILSLFLSADETLMNLFYRARHLSVILASSLIMWIIWSYRWRWGVLAKPKWFAVTVTCVLALMITGYTWVFIDQSRLSQFLPPEAVTAARIANLESPDGAIISNTWSGSVWIAAITKGAAIPMFSMQPPIKYQHSYEDVRCVMGWRPCDVSAAADALDAEWVIIDTRYPGALRGDTRMWRAPESPWQQFPSWLKLRWSSSPVMLFKITEPD